MAQKNKPTFSERALYLISPEAGNRRFRERIAKDRSHIKMASTGYGNHGASTMLNSLKGWLAGGGSAEEDIDLHGSLLRRRARDLYAGGGLGRSGPATLTTGVIAWGVKPKPKIDAELLGISDEAADEWERKAAVEFALWAESKFCDAARQTDFYGLQKLAFLNELVSGDCFVLIGMKENSKTPYQTTLRLLEADRISTPDSSGESTSLSLDNGGRIVDGVETDAEGAVVRYHISNRHPLSDDTTNLEWVSIDAYGKDSGEPNILHIATFERPEQRRGIPFAASQIELIKQLDRYLGSELLANVVSSMLTTFITSTSDDGQPGFEDAVNAEDKIDDDEMNIEMGAGVIYELPPNKDVKSVNPIRNNATFKDFVETLETIIGSGMGIPKEVLVKKYESNYTAARGALLDFWREVKIRRAEFNAAFNQPIYELWLAEAVASGRIEAPGFFDAPEIRKAWSGCMWIGSSMGHVDPLKEVNAAEQRIKLHITTEEQEASEYNGNDWMSNVRQRQKEIETFTEGEETDE